MSQLLIHRKAADSKKKQLLSIKVAAVKRRRVQEKYVEVEKEAMEKAGAKKIIPRRSGALPDFVVDDDANDPDYEPDDEESDKSSDVDAGAKADQHRE